MFVVHQVAFLSAFNSLASATHSSHRCESAYLAVIHPPRAPTALFSSPTFSVNYLISMIYSSTVIQILLPIL